MMNPNDEKKKLPSPIAQALKVIVESLENKNIDWVVITSCALALHGLDIEPEDIDIMTNDSGLLLINDLFNDQKITLSDNSASDIFDSTKSNFLIHDCSVEAMSNFKIKSRLDERWYDMSQLLQHKTMIAIDDLTIPVLPLTQLHEMYSLMDREKDTSKIEKLREHLEVLRTA